MVIDESTTGGAASDRELKGTTRWMAPELLLPEEFGFTGELLKQLPSMSTDIYAIGMAILEVSACPYPPRYQTHPLVGSDRLPSIQQLPQHLQCHVQSHQRESAQQTSLGIL